MKSASDIQNPEFDTVNTRYGPRPRPLKVVRRTRAASRTVPLDQCDRMVLLFSQWSVRVRDRISVLIFNHAGDPGGCQASRVSVAPPLGFSWFNLVSPGVFWSLPVSPGLSRSLAVSPGLACCFLVLVAPQDGRAAASGAEGPAAELLHQR